MVYTHVMCGNLKPIGFLHSVTPKEPSLPTGSKTVKPTHKGQSRKLDLVRTGPGSSVLHVRRSQRERKFSKAVLCAKGDTAVIVVYGVVEDEWGVKEEYS